MMLVAAGLMTGCGKDSEETPTKPEDPGDPIPPVTTTYEIGDYYENGFVKGIVIYIDSEGKSGTVVSLDETEAIWSYKYEEPMASFPQTGRYNTDCVYNMEGWRENYPGFLWCSEKDVLGVKNWYVPDQRELGLLYEAYSGVRGGGSLSDDEIRKNKQLFNDTLKEKGGVPLSDAVYWTSAECSARMAYAFDMASGAMIEMPQELDKGMKYKFRAMADFKF